MREAGIGTLLFDLLTREEEVIIARRMERGQRRVLKALSRSPVLIDELIEIGLAEIDGVTTLRLTHRGLSPPAAEAHAIGWGHYLGRLAARAEGGDPGPDP